MFNLSLTQPRSKGFAFLAYFFCCVQLQVQGVRLNARLFKEQASFIARMTSSWFPIEHEACAFVLIDGTA